MKIATTISTILAHNSPRKQGRGKKKWSSFTCDACNALTILQLTSLWVGLDELQLTSMVHARNIIKKKDPNEGLETRREKVNRRVQSTNEKEGL